MRLIDCSHTIEDGMVTYKGLPVPLICDYLSRDASRALYAPGTEFQIGKIEMVANTGTYVDSPFHRYADGADLAAMPLEALADLEVLVIRAEGAACLEADALRGLDLKGKAVLIHTGWDRHWRTDRYFEGHPYVTEAAAERLAASKVSLVGIDSHNIDNLEDLRRPVHSILLGKGIPICEHMTGLAAVPTRGARFFAVPPKVAGFGTFPVRAFAISTSGD